MLRQSKFMCTYSDLPYTFSRFSLAVHSYLYIAFTYTCLILRHIILKHVVLIQSCISHVYVVLTTNYMSVLGNSYNRYGIAFDFVSRLWYNGEYVDQSYCIMASTLDNRHRFVVIITRYSVAYDIALDPVRG